MCRARLRYSILWEDGYYKIFDEESDAIGMAKTLSEAVHEIAEDSPSPTPFSVKDLGRGQLMQALFDDEVMQYSKEQVARLVNSLCGTSYSASYVLSCAELTHNFRNEKWVRPEWLGRKRKKRVYRAYP